MQVLSAVPLVVGTSPTVRFDAGTIGLLIANESPLAVTVTLGGNSQWLPAWTLDYFTLENIQSAGGTITLTPLALSSASNAPSSSVLITLLQQGDKLNGTYPCPLTRQTNIGNGVIPTSSTNSIVNDGAAPNTTVIETTPSDESSSAFVLDNEGNLTLRTKDGGVWSVILNVAAGSGSGAATKLFHGTADNANAVPATGVTAGALPSSVTVAPNAVRSGALNTGVTITPAQLTAGDLAATTTVPTANIDSGALPSGVTIPGGQVTGDIAANQVGPGALDTDVTIAPSQLVGGTLSSSVTSPNYLPLAGGTVTGLLVLDKAMSGADVDLVQLQASNASPAARWTITQRFSGSNLAFVDNSNGAVPLTLSTAGGLIPNNGGSLSAIQQYSGTSSVTVTHGLGTTPGYVGITQNVTNSTDTVGVDSIGSSTFHVNIYGSYAWVAMAYAH